METTPFRHEAEVILSEPHGDTIVKITFGISGSKMYIPTDEIPPSLRAIGSKFIVTGHRVRPVQSDSIEDIRAAGKVTISQT